MNFKRRQDVAQEFLENKNIKNLLIICKYYNYNSYYNYPKLNMKLKNT